jgi:hypothetical protein
MHLYYYVKIRYHDKTKGIISYNDLWQYKVKYKIFWNHFISWEGGGGVNVLG